MDLRCSGWAGPSLEAFEKDLSNNLYKLWNRLASGSYFPPPVKQVAIPKGEGKVRKLSIPTVGDRIAQMVIKEVLEPRLEACFHGDSYGYRPGKSAHQALEQALLSTTAAVKEEKHFVSCNGTFGPFSDAFFSSWTNALLAEPRAF